MYRFSIVLVLLLTACTGIPKNVTPINNFSLDNYLGTWYEIARLDHSFERGLSRVTAEYSLLDSGHVRVLNRGFSEKKNAWKKAEGKARFVGENTVGHLKVSFFGPFYGSYIIVDLDHENYQYALVAGPSHKYLWLLSRTPDLDAKIRDSLIGKAQQLGFDTDAIIWVAH